MRTVIHSFAMVIRLICGFVLLAGWALAIERGEEMRLWAKGAPGSEGETAPEVFQAGANPKLPVRFTVVHYPSIYVFLPAKEKANGMADPAGPGSRAGSDLPHLHRVSGSVSGFAPDAASVGPTVPTSSAARSIAAGRLIREAVCSG